MNKQEVLQTTRWKNINTELIFTKGNDYYEIIIYKGKNKTIKTFKTFNDARDFYADTYYELEQEDIKGEKTNGY